MNKKGYKNKDWLFLQQKRNGSSRPNGPLHTGRYNGLSDNVSEVSQWSFTETGSTILCLISLWERIYHRHPPYNRPIIIPSTISSSLEARLQAPAKAPSCLAVKIRYINQFVFWIQIKLLYVQGSVSENKSIIFLRCTVIAL